MPRHNKGADRLTHSARVGDAAGSRADTYARVTAAIIAAIEHGAGEWHASYAGKWVTGFERAAYRGGC